MNPNAAMRTADGLLPERVVALTTAFFGETRSGFGLQLRLDADHDLADAVSGLNPLASSDCPAMMVEGPLDSPAVDADVRIASGPDDTAAYALVVDDAYQSLGWPAGSPGAVFASPSLLLRPDKAAFVARVDGQPAAAAYVHRTARSGWRRGRPHCRVRGRGSRVPSRSLRPTPASSSGPRSSGSSPRRWESRSTGDSATGSSPGPRSSFGRVWEKGARRPRKATEQAPVRRARLIRGATAGPGARGPLAVGRRVGSGQAAHVGGLETEDLCVEGQLGLGGELDVLGLAEPVLLPCEGDVA